MSIALLATIHDKNGKDLGLMRDGINTLIQIYDEVIFTISEVTCSAYIGELSQIPNCSFIVIPAKGAGDARRNVLKLALEKSHCDFFHCCDFDRILTWLNYDKKELYDLKCTIVKTDFLIIGRTATAFNCHPKSWIETEKITNTVASLALNMKVDITAGSCAMSRNAGMLIIKNSKAKMTDGEWPMIIHKLSSMDIDYIAVEGLKYIEDINSCKSPSSEINQWIGRVNLESIIVSSIEEYVNNF